MVLFNGCAHKSAFEDFNITREQELSEDIIQSSKIEKNNYIDGIVTAIYLNKVRPKIYKKHEYFYIYMYRKDVKRYKVSFFLNSKQSIKVTELDNPNKFTSLTSANAQWLQYYLVEFNEGNNILNLQIKSKGGNSTNLIFKKDE
jgi:hypothetical protein